MAPDLLDADGGAGADQPRRFNGNLSGGRHDAGRPRRSADLMAGRWYVEVQTEKFPAGEIRGQIVKALIATTRR